MAQTWLPSRTLSLGCEVRLLADNTLKTTGSVYGAIYNAVADTYWNGSAWSATPGVLALTHEFGGEWRYSLASGAWIDGAEILLKNITDDSGGAASATIYGCKEESAYATSATPTSITTDIAAVPTAAENATAVDAALADDFAAVPAAVDAALAAAHGSGTWENQPSGTNLVTITVTDVDGGAPLVGATVYVYDSTETNVLRGGVTNGAGQFSCYLDNGTYDARVSLANYAFATPATFTVNETPEAVSITGAAVGTAPTPVAPNGCMVYGVLRDAGGDPVVGATVKAYARTPQIVDPDTFSSGVVSTTTAADGTWSLELVQGAVVIFEIESAAGVGYYKAAKTVPAASTQDFATW